MQFEDYALGGVTFGHIDKTTDGGQTWTTKNNGIGSLNEGTFRSGSQLLFVNEYIDFVKSNTSYDSGVTAEYGDELITLSTCASHTEDGRFVVVARRITGDDK